MLSQYETNSHSLPRILTDQRKFSISKRSNAKTVSGLAEKFQKNWLQNKISETKEIDDSLTSLTWLHNVPSILGPPSPSISPSIQCSFSSDSLLQSNGNNNRDSFSSFSHLDCALKDGGLLDPLVRHDYKTNWSGKPPFSYATLICMAMRELNKTKITLSDIYNWITENFIYYRLSDSSWQNSVRHNLSLNKCFEKVPRGKDERGKGGFWRINPKYADRLESNLIKYRRQFPLPNTPSPLHHQSSSFVPVAKSSNGLPAASTLLSRKLMMMTDENEEDEEEFGRQRNVHLPPSNNHHHNHHQQHHSILQSSSHSIMSSSDSVSSLNTIGSGSYCNGAGAGPTTDTPLIHNNNNSNSNSRSYKFKSQHSTTSINNTTIYLPNLPLSISTSTTSLTSFRPNISNSAFSTTNNQIIRPILTSGQLIRQQLQQQQQQQHQQQQYHNSLDEFRTSETGRKVDTQIHHRFTMNYDDDDDDDDECEDEDDEDDCNDLRVRTHPHHPSSTNTSSPTIYSLLQHSSESPSIDEIDSAVSSSFDTDLTNTTNTNHHHRIHGYHPHSNHLHVNDVDEDGHHNKLGVPHHDHHHHNLSPNHHHQSNSKLSSRNNRPSNSSDDNDEGFIVEESDEFIPHRDPLFDSVNSQFNI